MLLNKNIIMKINIVNKSKNELPSYGTEFSAGMDLRAEFSNEEEFITIKPLQRQLIKTGLFIEIPEGYEANIRPRSGLSLKNGITVLNAPGTIDADYRGEIGVILVNLSDTDFIVNQGDRIAQMVIAKFERAELSNVLLLTDTERGAGGFGHTGKK